MRKDLDVSLAQLWISHLCHELVSPIGAINNGIELIEEAVGDGLERDALQLIADSGRSAAAKLRFYRIAYGKAGTAADLSLSEARGAVIDLFAADSRIAFEFPPAPSRVYDPGSVQLLLNLILLAGSCLPRGGSLDVAIIDRDVAADVLITARGINARIPELVAETIAGRAAEIDHRNSHVALCQALAGQIGCDFAVVADEGQVVVTVSLVVRSG